MEVPGSGVNSVKYVELTGALPIWTHSNGELF